MNSDLAVTLYIIFWGLISETIEKRLKCLLGPRQTWGVGVLLLLIIIVMFFWQGNPFSENASLGPWLRFVSFPISMLAVTICSDCIRYYISRFFHKDAA